MSEGEEEEEEEEEEGRTFSQDWLPASTWGPAMLSALLISIHDEA